LIVALIVVGVFLFDRLLSGANSKQILGGSKDIRVAEKELERGLDITAMKSTIRASYESIKPYLKAISGREADARTLLLQELDKIVRESKGSILALNLRDIEEDTGLYKKYQANLKFDIDPAQLPVFLGKISDSFFLLELDRVKISQNNSASTVVSLDCLVSLIVPQTNSQKSGLDINNTASN
jgi:hypothetical protein